MPSLVRYHTAVPKRLLGISYNITNDDRATSAQEPMPSGRQSRIEHRYHTAVPTRQVHKSIRASDEQHHKYTRALLEGSLTYRGTEMSCQSVVYLVVYNRHVFNWPTERRQFSDILLGISYPVHVCVPPLYVMFSSFCDPCRIFRYPNIPAVETTSVLLGNCLLGISNISRYTDLLSICRLSCSVTTDILFIGQQSVVSSLTAC